MTAPAPDQNGVVRPRVPRGLIVGGAVFVMFAGTVWMFGMAWAGDEPVDVPELFRRQLPLTVPTLLLAPGVVWLARRFPIRVGRWRVSIGVHALGITVMLLAHGGLSAVGMRWVIPEEVSVARDWGDLFWGVASGWFYLFIMTYLAILGAIHAYDNSVESRRKERVADRLETRFLEAQLASLRGRLQPHFLFNTLQAVSGLVDEDPRAARSMLARLGNLLRASLETSRRQVVTLGQEIDFVRGYLEIQATRFRDRLTVEVDVPGGLFAARVPGFILQPIVENALRHGIAPGLRGRVAVAASEDGGMLTLVVRDDGGGESPAAPETWTEGVGLSATRQRLEAMYGNRHEMDVRLRESGGVEVVLRIPFRTNGEET